MTITVKYFASLREALGATEAVEPGEGPLTVGALRQRLAALDAAHHAVLGPERLVRAAVNHAMVTEEAPVPDGSEVGFFPPVTGG